MLIYYGENGRYILLSNTYGMFTIIVPRSDVTARGPAIWLASCLVECMELTICALKRIFRPLKKGRHIDAACSDLIF